MKKSVYILFLILCIGKTFSQEEETQKWTLKDNVSVNGYVKYLPNISFTKNDVFSNNLIHNRINFKAFLGENLTLKIGLRNRLIFGEQVKNTPNYGSLLAEDNGEMDLSFLIIDKKALVLHSVFDRAYLDFAKGKWQISLGRQRINWGINLAWNSNDLFNAYNIVDFDYQEKEGTDALRVQYALKNSNLEVGYKPGKDLDHTILASLYKFNKWQYDFQFMVANYNTDFAIGTGWAGNIKKAGFKGEATYFIDKENSDKVTSASTSIDYFFKKGFYINVSALYTSNGEQKFNPSVLNFTSGNLSAKKLMPTKFSYLTQVSNEFNPQLKASITTIYGAGMDLVFVMPSIDYSIKQNWDLNLTGQLFYAKTQDDFSNLSNSIYLGLRYSY